MKKCDVCKGYPAANWRGDDYGVLNMCDRCYPLYGYDSYRDDLTMFKDKDGNDVKEPIVVAKVHANGIEWKKGYHAPESYIDETKINHRDMLSPDERAKKLADIAPGCPIVGRWRRCTSPGTICMVRYDLNVPVNDKDHGYVEVIKILVCPIHVNEMASCPANRQAQKPVIDDGDD